MAKVLLGKARYTRPDQGVIVPPLGVMYIASVLREAGHQVQIFDLAEDWNRTDRFRDALLAFAPDVVGLSALTQEAGTMEGMATLTRSLLPEVPIIVGGPHASAYPRHCATHPAIDFAVLGEGERTAVELVNALVRGGDPTSVSGIAYQDASGEVVFTEEREVIEDVDDIPFPAWDLVDVDRYARTSPMSNMGRRRYMLMFTSRGCPFKCIYCHEVQGKRFRARSPENVLREMHELKRRYGIRDFEIIDDIFNFNRRRMLEILDRVIASDLDAELHFPNALRTDLLDEVQIAKLRAAGTYSLSVAVETVTPRLQKLIKKHLDVEKVRENIEIAVRRQMWVRGFFMLGFPTETLEEVRATVDFALKSNLHEGMFFLVTPYAGTALYELYQELLRERGIELPDFQTMEPFKGNTNLSVVPNAELFSLQQSAFRRFYGDPRRVLRAFARHPRPLSLIGYGLRAALMSLPVFRATSDAEVQSVWTRVAAPHARKRTGVYEPVRRPTVRRRGGRVHLAAASTTDRMSAEPAARTPTDP